MASPLARIERQRAGALGRAYVGQWVHTRECPRGQRYRLSVNRSSPSYAETVPEMNLMAFQRREIPIAIVALTNLRAFGWLGTGVAFAFCIRRATQNETVTSDACSIDEERGLS